MKEMIFTRRYGLQKVGLSSKKLLSDHEGVQREYSARNQASQQVEGPVEARSDSGFPCTRGEHREILPFK
jgi:hypothetical protein